MADRIAKEDDRSKDTNIAFNRIPKSTIHYEVAEEAKQQWQSEWKHFAKATTKKYFPNGQNRLNIKEYNKFSL